MVKKRSKAVRVFAQNLRSLREERGLSQEKLAEYADVHTTFISRIENRQVNISIMNMEKIAKGLGSTLEQLLKGC